MAIGQLAEPEPGPAAEVDGVERQAAPAPEVGGAAEPPRHRDLRRDAGSPPRIVLRRRQRLRRRCRRVRPPDSSSSTPPPGVGAQRKRRHDPDRPAADHAAPVAVRARPDGPPRRRTGLLLAESGRPRRKMFRCWKLRSMVVDAESQLADYFASNPAARAEWDDPPEAEEESRITRIGRLLRKSSLDELPQLWNVLPRRDEPRRPAADDARAARPLSGHGLLQAAPGTDRLLAGQRPQRYLVRGARRLRYAL